MHQPADSKYIIAPAIKAFHKYICHLERFFQWGLFSIVLTTTQKQESTPKSEHQSNGLKYPISKAPVS